MKTFPIFRAFVDRPTLTRELSQRVCSALQEAIDARGHAGLVVSGGKTPVPLFCALSDLSIAWEKVFITLADERWVNTVDKHSNENLVRKHLLKNRAAYAKFVGMKTDAATAVEGEAACAARLARIPMPFDVVILGMGEDGHTASLFPGAETLSAALDMQSGKMCMGIASPDALNERMTLTLPAILHSRQIMIHMVGEQKRKAYEKAVGDGAVDVMPIRGVLKQRIVPVTVFWAP